METGPPAQPAHRDFPDIPPVQSRPAYTLETID